MVQQGLREAKSLIGEVPPESWVVGLGRLHSQKQRIAVGWLRGHWKVAYHLCKIGLMDSPDCRPCSVEEETTEQLP